MAPIEILDTCALLNLYATGRLEEVAQSRSGSFAIAERVKEEALWLRQGGPGVHTGGKIAVDLQPFISSGILNVLRLESTEDVDLFLHFAGDVNLDDGEAATCALAVQRAGLVVTDERKTTHIMHQHYPMIQCLSSLHILKEWADRGAISASVLRIILLDISLRANYRPYHNHPLYEWWNGIIVQ